MTSIPVAHPTFWWRGNVTDLRSFVLEDPDVVDRRRPRWPDAGQQRWNLIAGAVADVGDALGDHQWSIDPELPTCGVVELQSDAQLQPTELAIVRARFSEAESVRADPWSDLTNGRHRLWATLPHFGARAVPVKGAVIEYATPADTAVLGPSWPDMFAANLSQLDSISWLNRADRVNQTFRGMLAAAAEARYPDPTAIPPHDREADTSGLTWGRKILSKFVSR